MKQGWLLLITLSVVFSFSLNEIIQKGWERIPKEGKNVISTEPQSEENIETLVDQEPVHTCIHHLVQQEIVPPPETPSSKRQVYGTGPFRVKVDYSALGADNDAGSTCKTVGQVVSVLGTGPYTCQTDDILTPELVAFYQTNLAPTVIQAVEAMIPQTKFAGPFSINARSCAGINIGSEYRSPNTITDAEYIVYVTGRPAAVNSTVAYASPCDVGVSTQGSRPVVGFISFTPRNFKQFASGTINQFQFSGAVRIGVHEMTHALGFSSAVWRYFVDDSGNSYNPISTYTKSGVSAAGNAYSVNVTRMSTPNVINYAKKYFGCESLLGVDLEDGGTTSTAGQHWERRVVGDEYMNGYADPVNPITGLTLSLFADMGWYLPNSSVAEYHGWGKAQGCAWLNDRCENSWTRTPFAGYYCNSTTRVYGCTADRTEKGVCMVGAQSVALPPYYQHFANPTWRGLQTDYDYCSSFFPYNGLSNYQCQDPNATPDTVNEYYGYYSRCFEYSAGRTVNEINPLMGCFEHRCTDNNTLQVRYGNTWYQCPHDGGIMNLATGSMNCPKASLLCMDISPFNTARLVNLPTDASFVTNVMSSSGSATSATSPSESSSQSSSPSESASSTSPNSTLPISSGIRSGLATLAVFAAILCNW